MRKLKVIKEVRWPARKRLANSTVLLLFSVTSCFSPCEGYLPNPTSHCRKADKGGRWYLNFLIQMPKTPFLSLPLRSPSACHCSLPNIPNTFWSQVASHLSEVWTHAFPHPVIWQSLLSTYWCTGTVPCAGNSKTPHKYTTTVQLAFCMYEQEGSLQWGFS